METIKSFEDIIYEVNDGNVEAIALKLFHFQAENNPLYRTFLQNIGSTTVRSLQEIPFLPISFFKNHAVQSGSWTAETIFTSSGTTGNVTSQHFVKDIVFYRNHSEKLFVEKFGPLQNYHFIALLPSYFERTGSSLVVMADHFIRRSGSPHSGFYLNNLAEMADKLVELRGSPKKVILLGVTFALLELAEKYPMDLSHCLIMETGGMKGRRKEIIREELHTMLCKELNVPLIYSEYGMTELLSQAYSEGHGRFKPSSTLKIVIRDVNDPRQLEKRGRTGAINVIDLANIYSCAFIETEDLGRMNQDGSFEVLGRMDNSDIRGCNLLVG